MTEPISDIQFGEYLPMCRLTFHRGLRLVLALDSTVEIPGNLPYKGKTRAHINVLECQVLTDIYNIYKHGIALMSKRNPDQHSEAEW